MAAAALRVRLRLVSACLLAALALLMARVSWLQLGPRQEFLQRQGEIRQQRDLPIPAHRGMILDARGEVLAVSAPVHSIAADPARLRKALDARPDALPLLARHLGMSAEHLQERLRSRRQFIYLDRLLAPAEAGPILALGLDGLHDLREYRRYYPAGEIAAHLVGITDIDDRGQEGMELAFDDHLRGRPGSRRIVRDRRGRVVEALHLNRAAAPGGNLELTIDMRLQYVAYKALKQAVSRHGAASASLVLVDTASGDILALANQPSYNPNNRATFHQHRIRNRAIKDLFEPGSTVKPLAMLAALESGAVDGRSRVDTSPGELLVDDKLLRDPRNYGVLSPTGIIAKSSQVGISRIALGMEADSIRQMYRRLGLHEAAVGFSGESRGRWPTQHSRLSDLQRANLAFGYGITITAAQLARAYCIIARDGMDCPLQMVRGAPRGEMRRLLPGALARQVRSMLHAATGPGGTARGAVPASHSAAGKTGTVHLLGDDGQYDKHRYVSLFAGMAPAEHPRIVAVVVVRDPQGELYSGGAVAAPVFARVSEDVLRILGAGPEAAAAVLAGGAL